MLFRSPGSELARSFAKDFAGVPEAFRKGGDDFREIMGFAWAQNDFTFLQG